MTDHSPLPPEMPADRRRRLSLHGLAESFGANLTRWPLTVIYVCLAAVWMLIEVWHDGTVLSENFELATSYLIGEGALTTLAVSLWCDFLGCRRSVMYAQAVANVLLVADYIYLLFNATELGNAGIIARGAITTALVVAVVFMPPRRRGENVAWYYSYAQISNIVTTGLVAIVMWIALSIIYGTLEMLFDISSTKSYVTLLILGAFFIPAMLLLYRIPTPDEIVRDEAEYSPARFTLGLIKYLLSPLAIVYMAILYVYGIRILVSFEWPRGMVSYAVSGMTAVTVLLYFLLEAVCLRGSEPVYGRLRRVMPLAIVPLLVMMSVAIGMRINQYGITASRLYLLAFNVWAYGAMLWLGLGRSKCFNIIPASFVGVFLLVSVIPGANFTAITHAAMRSSAFATLRTLGVEKFPISQEQAIGLQRTADTDLWASLSSQMRYLDNVRDHSLVADIVDFPVQISSWEYADVFRERWGSHDADATIEFTLGDSDNTGIEIPAGYSQVKYITVARYDIGSIADGKFGVTLDEGYELTVTPESLGKQKTLEPMRLRSLPTEQAIFVPTHMQCRYTPGADTLPFLRVEGYLFTTDQISIKN